MSLSETPQPVVTKPILLFFTSKTNGRSRRAEGFLANESKVQGRLVEPHGCEEIQAFLAPWLK